MQAQETMLALQRPPERWRKVGEPHYGSPIRIDPDANIHILVCNALDPDAPQLIDPSSPFEFRRALEEALHPRGVRESIEFTRKQGKIVGRHLWGDSYSTAGMYWQLDTVESIGLLRTNMLIDPWSVRKIAEVLGLDMGYVGKTLRAVASKLDCHRQDLRDMAQRGLQAEQLRIGRRLGLW